MRDKWLYTIYERILVSRLEEAAGFDIRAGPENPYEIKHTQRFK